MRQIIKLVPCDVAARPLLSNPNKAVMIGLLDAGFFWLILTKGLRPMVVFDTRHVSYQLMGATTIPCLISRLKLSEIELIIQHLSRPLHQKAIDDIKSLGPINQPSEQISHQIGAL